ncbi:MAG TPA: xanthine dehydrogenase [Firmicutes bacterium]|nr:xanthine dehydrogenase [Bacillota bacterium]
MIPFDFEYYQPETLQEATDLYQSLDRRGLQPLYYGGGTEIISMARLNTIQTGAVIDLKSIPECRRLEVTANQLIIGAAVTLTAIVEAKVFPLLSRSGGRIADHTIRDRITIGGNLCGKIIYREAVLPLLLTDSELVIMGPGGQRRVGIQEVFQETMHLNPGEFVVQVGIDPLYTSLPYQGIKKTRLDKIDYPLVSIAVLKKDGKIRLAVSGLCAFPFRSLPMEEELNKGDIPLAERIRHLSAHLPAPILSDPHGSAEYREFLFQNTLLKMVRELEEVS